MSSIHSVVNSAHYALAAAATTATAARTSSYSHPTNFIGTHSCTHCSHIERSRVKPYPIELSAVSEKIRQFSGKVPSQEEIFAIFHKDYNSTEQDIILVGSYLKNRGDVNAFSGGSTLLCKTIEKLKVNNKFTINPIFKTIFKLLLSNKNIDVNFIPPIYVDFTPRIILETAVQGDKVMQDFESESLAMGVDHSQRVKATPIASDYGSKDCVTLSPSTAVSRIMEDSPLIKAIDLHLSDETKLLIAQNADITARASDGRTPLHMADCPHIVWSILDRAAAIEAEVHNALGMKLSSVLINLIWDLNALCVAKTNDHKTPLNALTVKVIKLGTGVNGHYNLISAQITTMAACALAILLNSRTIYNKQGSGNENNRALALALTDNTTLDQVLLAAKACSSELSLSSLSGRNICHF